MRFAPRDTTVKPIETALADFGPPTELGSWPSEIAFMRFFIVVAV